MSTPSSPTQPDDQATVPSTDEASPSGAGPVPTEGAEKTVGAEDVPRRGVSRRAANVIIPSVLVLAGVSVLLYPVLATQWNNHKQHAFAEQYASAVKEVPDAALEEALASARQYNTTINGIPILDPYLEDVEDPKSKAFDRYMGELSLLDTMARVRVPSVRIDLPVRHTTNDDVLAEGVGHLYGTSLPVGGTGTHAVLTSHTGMSDATLFDNLHTVKEGELMLIDVYGETLAYEVDQIKVVLPEEISDLTPVEGKDYLTLFTCTPYAVNTHRLLVRGHRVPYTPEKDEEARRNGSGFIMQSWMWWLLAAALLGLVSLGAIAWREHRARRAAAEADEANGSAEASAGTSARTPERGADGTAPDPDGVPEDVPASAAPAVSAATSASPSTGDAVVANDAADTGAASAAGRSAPSPNEAGTSWTRPVD